MTDPRGPAGGRAYTTADVGADHSPSSRLTAQLWYDRAPALDDPALLAALRALPGADVQTEADGVMVAHTGVTIDMADPDLPAGTALPLATVVIPGSQLNDDEKTLPDPGQTWDWAEVEAALAGCTHSVLVTELLSRLFTPPQRVTGLMSVLQVLVEHTRPLAIDWPNSQRITDPARFDPEALDGVVNVRFFTVGAGAGGGPEAMVMDTLGLDLFELPDAQCHYRDYSPAEVAALLFTTAVYVFTEGDVIDDGHTISGPRGDERLVCRHEQALIGPTRTVLDIDLGEPYAAGHQRRG